MDSLSSGSYSLGPVNSLFLAALQFLVFIQSWISPPEIWNQDAGPNITDGQTFDYIVIGAGSAGSVIANRLTENPKISVLLLEAGGNPPAESEVIALHPTIISTQFDWQFFGHSANACGNVNNNCTIPRGKMLGGSSSMTWMIYVRGNQGDFDYWEQLGNPGWDSKTVWEYYKKSENNTYQPFLDEDKGKWHSNKGPMNVEFCRYTPPSDQLYIKALAEKGIPFIADINADVHEGVTNVQGTINGARRESTAKAFLVSARNRPNLRVVKTAFVEQILIDKNNKAYGVQYKYNGTTIRKANVKKEVISSAGVIMSPVLLMHSGIGPATQLQKYKIPSKVNLNVGGNLIDHPVSILFASFKPTKPDPPTQPIQNIIDWAVSGRGRLSGIAQLWAFLRTNTSRPINRPDTEADLIYFSVNSTDLLTFMEQLRFSADNIQEIAKINAKRDVGFFIVGVIQPKSRGSVQLGGPSVYDKPLINLNLFDNNDDLELMVTAFQNHLQLLETRTFKSFDAQPIYLSIAACNKFPRSSRDYWKCYIKYFSATAYHQVGTCKMGPKSDPNAVVDARLRVHGVKNLRVADASIMPYITSGNINAPTIMIGEKAADMIKEDNK